MQTENENLKRQIQSKPNNPISACGCDKDHNSGDFPYIIYKGKKVYFCTEDCKEEFNEDPVEFLNSEHFVLEFDTLEDA